MLHVDAPELLYDLKVMPAGRVPFRRVRWELWHGPRLVATGWRTSDQHAERALRTAAARLTHRLLGVVPLHPEATVLSGRWRTADTVQLDCGVGRCRLTHRRAQRLAA